MKKLKENRSFDISSCKKVILIAIVFLAFLLVTGSIVSGIKFQVKNPFNSTYGLIQVMFTQKDYVVIQQSPKVVIAKPTASLTEYMKKVGYIEEENSRLGAMLMFTNGEKAQNVTYRVNAYYSVWNWAE